MADELKLDIIVDEHGSAKKLADVDAGVNKILGSAKQATPATAQLSAGFGGMALSLGRLVGLTSGVAAFFKVIQTVRAVADEASRLQDVADRLDVSASQFQKVASAASEFGIASDSLAGAIGRLQTRIGSGQINDELTKLGINLEDIRDADGVSQFQMLAAAIGAIESPTLRAAAAQATLGRDGEAMRAILTKAFAETAAGASSMSDTTIRELDEMGEAVTRFAASAKNKLGEALIAFANFANSGQNAVRDFVGDPTMPSVTRPTGPEGLPALPVPTFDRASADQLAEMLKGAEDLRKELFGSVDASIQLQDVWLNASGAIEFVSPIITTIRDAQREIRKDAEAWGETLNTRVLGTLTVITDRLAGIISSEGAEQARLMQKLSGPTDANQSEFDKGFLAIDQELKDKLANAATLPTRGAQILAENEALETAQLKVQELQMQWEKVNAAKDAAIGKTNDLASGYQRLTSMLSPGGQQLPNGLVAPTAEQLATGRFFGPVTPNGQPDLARFGGAAPAPNVIQINAANSVNTDGWDSLVRRIEQGLAERDRNQGTRTRR